jgi:hypothetical protein
MTVLVALLLTTWVVGAEFDGWKFPSPEKEALRL